MFGKLPADCTVYWLSGLGEGDVSRTGLEMKTLLPATTQVLTSRCSLEQPPLQIQCCSQVYLGGLSQGAWTKAPWPLVSHWHQYSLRRWDSYL